MFHNQSLFINPRAVWFNKKGIKKFVSRFSSATNILLSKKIFSGKEVKFYDILNPVAINSDDTSLVSRTNTIRNTIFFNRTSSIYGIDYIFNYNENTNLLTSGIEKRKLISNALKVRWNATKSITLNGIYTNGFKQNDSDFYLDRRYEYIFNQVESSFSWLFKSFFRINVNYMYAFKSNPLKENGGQFLVSNAIGTELKFTKAGNFNVLAKFSYTSIAYNDSKFKNEQLEIDMLQGLQNGHNYVWLVSFDKTIAKNFQVSLVYDARKTGVSKIVHTGRAQVRAIF